MLHSRMQSIREGELAMTRHYYTAVMQIRQENRPLLIFPFCVIVALLELLP